MYLMCSYSPGKQTWVLSRNKWKFIVSRTINCYNAGQYICPYTIDDI